MALSRPWCRCVGDTKPTALCRCRALYQSTKDSTHAVACLRIEKAAAGYSDLYFNVRKRASEKGLPSLTRGRLSDVITPSDSSVALSVAPLIRPSLS